MLKVKDEKCIPDILTNSFNEDLAEVDVKRDVTEISFYDELVGQNGDAISCSNLINLNVKIEKDLVCEDCSITFCKGTNMKHHLISSKHQKCLKRKLYDEMREQKDPSVYCDICDLYTTIEAMPFHLKGMKHMRKCKSSSEEESNAKKMKIVDVETSIEHCGYCLVNFTDSKEAIDHYQSKAHLQHIMFYCNNCHVFCYDQKWFNMHLKGWVHNVLHNADGEIIEQDQDIVILNKRGVRGGKPKRLRRLAKRRVDTVSIDSHEQQLIVPVAGASFDGDVESVNCVDVNPPNII